MEQEEILLNADAPETEVKPQESAPVWATSMADTMKALAEKVSAPAHAPAPGLSKEQVDDINSRITKGIVDGNPLGTLAPLAGQVAHEIVDNKLSPVIAEAVDGFVDRFRSHKKEDYDDKGQLSVYRQVAKQFEKEIEGEDLSFLVSKSRTERDKYLDRVWKAAAGEVLGKKVSVREPRPAGASASGGGEMGGGNKNSGYKLSEREKTQLYRSMSKEAAEKAIADIESALAGLNE